MFYGVFLSFASYAAYAISDACVKFIDGALPPYETAFFGALISIIVIPFLKNRDNKWIDIIRSQNWPMWFLRTISGAFGVISIIIVRHMGGREKRITLYSSGIIGSIVICGLLSLPGYIEPHGFEWLYLAGYGLFAALGALFLMAAARRVPAIAIATPQYSQMIWAILFGYFIFNDHLDLPMIIGIILIMASSLLTFMREKHHSTQTTPQKPTPQKATP